MIDPPLVIGDLRDDEVEAVIALWRAAGLTRSWNDPHIDAHLALYGPGSTILAGRLDGALVATAMVGFDGHRASVYYLGVAPERQGRGFGRAMMAACEAWARDLGAPKLQLMVRDDNPAAAFYEALGYTINAVQVFGKRLD